MMAEILFILSLEMSIGVQMKYTHIEAAVYTTEQQL